ncbi:general secretion pathway protein GspE [Endozoicomonas numazuensis]|uniref:Type II secretion system protein E n=1 Tax=Endozoicomonas numazuensis TaxID=1137799 RepID=A0A081NHZ8_9GAMM|nr:general secretion pathway protein GspE [Endozoicomonas numazuensis]
MQETPLLNEQDSPPKRLPFFFAKKQGIVIVREQDKSTAYFHQYPVPTVLTELMRFSTEALHYQQVSEEQFAEHLSACYQNDTSDALQDAAGISDELDLTRLAEAVPTSEDLLEQSDDAPVIRLINALLSESLKQEASDIHIETFESLLIVRIRVDGVLREILRLQRTVAALLVSRIKVMAKLDIAEKRIPQDGRISLRVAGKEVDVRVSTLPSSNGERVVLRLLDKAKGKLDLNHLGISSTALADLKQLLKKPYGILLVTGPTGSGKTTTLYASLTSLNDQCRNILTVEDPIEYQLQGIGQTQVNTKVDMTFARGLRAILRQDPDVVMVGEIRDQETAEIAVQASLTGHLVLSTLHTNTAVGALTRLKDMGVEPFLLASSLVGVVAQRLVRVLCPDCKEAYPPSPAECQQLSIPFTPELQFYKAVGCPECNHNGYRGRTGIYEVVTVDETLKQMILENQGEQRIADYVHQHTSSILNDGQRNVLSGLTSPEEVLRVTVNQ